MFAVTAVASSTRVLCVAEFDRSKQTLPVSKDRPFFHVSRLPCSMFVFLCSILMAKSYSQTVDETICFFYFTQQDRLLRKTDAELGDRSYDIG